MFVDPRCMGVSKFRTIKLHRNCVVFHCLTRDLIEAGFRYVTEKTPSGTQRCQSVALGQDAETNGSEGNCGGVRMWCGEGALRPAPRRRPHDFRAALYTN
jgi:hypothetical protein